MMEGVCIDKKDWLSNSIIELFYDNCFIQAGRLFSYRCYKYLFDETF